MALVGTGTGARPVAIGADHPPRRDLHGVFIPGGMLNLPDTTATPHGRIITDDQDPGHAPRSPEQAQAWRQRVAFQRGLITEARETGLPALGVCGGSRAMAQCALRDEEGRGSTYLLPEAQRVLHNHHFSRPWEVAHTIDVEPDSQLGRIVRGEHWRDRGQPLLTRMPGGRAPPGADPRLYADPEPNLGRPLRIPVNSMHWAAAVFDQRAPAAVAVTAREPGTQVVEAWERQGDRFFMGIQSHPEFSQIPFGDFGVGDASLPHQRVMAALGQAATERLAIGIIRRNRPFMNGVRAARERARERIAERQMAQTAFGMMRSLFDDMSEDDGGAPMSRAEFDRIRP